MGVVHRGGRGIERTEINELGENRNVILEVGFSGKGLDLLELWERRALGYERERSVWVGFWVRESAYLNRWGCHA